MMASSSDDTAEPMRNDDSNHETLDSSEKTPQKEEFQEVRYGWVVVASVFLINAHTWGMNSAYAVFLAYYLSSNYFPGTQPIAFAFVGGLSISIAFLFAPLATACIGKFGTRTTLLTGLLFEVAAFIGASFATQLYQLILSQGIAFGIGMGFLFTGTVGLIPQWFHKRRSFANAFGTAGSGFGGLTYSLGANAMIQNLGLPWAFRILAILAAVVNGVASLMAKDRNKEVGAVHAAFRMELFRRKEFWMYLSWAWFSLLGYIIVVFSIADYARTVGFTASQGSLVAALFNLSQGLGRPCIGLVSDRVGRINIAGIATLIASLAAFLLWTFAGQYYGGLIVYAFFGAFAGCMWPTIAPVAAEVVGLQLLPSAMSITWLVLVLPATFAEVIALGLTKPARDGYLDVQMFTATMFALAFISIWILRVWKIHDLESKAFSDTQREKDGTEGKGLQQSDWKAFFRIYRV